MNRNSAARAVVFLVAGGLIDIAGVAEADPLPGFDLDSEQLAARMENGLAYQGGKDDVLMGWVNLRSGERRLWRCGVLTRIPPLAILGECDRESHFDLVCWNEANSLAEQVQRPYLAARHIAFEDVHAPVDRFRIIEPMTELAVRYEDRPDERDGVAAEIVRRLDAFRARAPWPITE